MTSWHPLRFSVRPRTVTVALAAAVVGATVLGLLPVPVIVRSFVVFPVLVVVAGWSVSRLVVGRSVGESVLRASLPGLSGLLFLLVVVLLLAVVGVPVGTAEVVVGAGVAALGLVVAARWGTLLEPGGSPVRVVVGVRRLAGPVVGVVVVVAAVAGAVAMRPVVVERYAQVALATPGVGEPLSAQENGRVRLGWVLRGFGVGLPGSPPVVGVVVGGAPAAQVVSRVGGLESGGGQGFVDERTGSVSFVAPGKAGLYEVRVDVGGSADLVVQLEVRP